MHFFKETLDTIHFIYGASY